MQSQFWCFTINNPESDPDFLDYAYFVYQYEMEATLHIQGYVIFNTRKRRDTVSKMIPGAFLQVRYGTHEQAKAYCMKEETRIDGPYEFGSDVGFTGGQGKRTDWLDIFQMIHASQAATDMEIAQRFPGHYARNFKGIERLRMLGCSKPRDFKTEVTLYFGPPGAGKSRHVYEEFGPAAYYKPPGHKWFDYYAGHDVVVFDDFRGSWFCYSTLLNLLDRYPCMVEVKGGMLNFAPKKIIITSNVIPEKWYEPSKQINIQALLRRIDHTVYFCGEPEVLEAFYRSTFE